MTLDQPIIGDCRTVLPTLPEASAQCVVTSPPYWGLRDYGADGQLGLEPTPDAYVAAMVEVFRQVRRVLKPDGVLWLNLGDSYIANIKGSTGHNSTLTNPTRQQNAVAKFAKKGSRGAGRPKTNGRGEPQSSRVGTGANKGAMASDFEAPHRTAQGTLKSKDLVGIPWRVALALQADGWWLRSDVVWSKPAPMPESVTDRPTRSHEYVFLLTKASRYFYDAKAIAERAVSGAPSGNKERKSRGDYGGIDDNRHQKICVPWADVGGTRNARSVWTIASQPYDGAHFATMPPALVERCVLAGSRIGDTVLDPFLGSGTVGMVAESLGRRWVGIELNPAYAPLIAGRTAQRGLLAVAAGGGR